jgi:RNA 2',3'-cyclic 3'-phosphodiesterase
MRMFLAVDLDEPTRKLISARMGQLRQLLALTNRDLANVANWTPAGKLHITLHFLGEVPHERLAPLQDGLAPALRVKPFNIACGALGVFPAGRPPRVIWQALSAGRAGMNELHAEVAKRLVALRFRVEDRPFAAHLTLARLKWPTQVDIGALLDTVAPEPTPPLLVDHVTLYRSELTPTGSVYGSLLRIPVAC